MCLLIITTLTVFSGNLYAESAVWKISKDDQYFYLGGTVHLLSPSDHPLPAEFTQAYQDADSIIFETDLVESKSPAFQARFFQAMTYSDGRTLETVLNPETYKRLGDFLAARNIPLENLALFQPWGAALLITVMEYQRLGMLPEYGVEEYFSKLATRDKRQILALESADEQLSFLQSMADVEPNTSMDYTLQDLEQLPEFIDFLKTSWRTGDVEAFSSHTYIVKMKSEFPELYQALVTRRNNAWMKQLATLNNNDTTEFVLVGTMHLNGEEGLLSQLRSLGFAVAQL
ncbi:MAG TPA: TraB/GumN family protein [Porticoccaceae bacterium]|nr:TraB/GumN family protein [Porticoccaceae bacterium]